MFIRVSTWETDQSLLEQLLSRQSVDRVRTRLEEQEIFLTQLQGSLARESALPRATFATLVQSVLQRFPMIRAVAWAPRVEGADRIGFEAVQRADWPGYAIRTAAPDDTFRAGACGGRANIIR